MYRVESEIEFGFYIEMDINGFCWYVQIFRVQIFLLVKKIFIYIWTKGRWFVQSVRVGWRCGFVDLGDVGQDQSAFILVILDVSLEEIKIQGGQVIIFLENRFNIKFVVLWYFYSFCIFFFVVMGRFRLLFMVVSWKLKLSRGRRIYQGQIYRTIFFCL